MAHTTQKLIQTEERLNALHTANIRHSKFLTFKSLFILTLGCAVLMGGSVIWLNGQKERVEALSAYEEELKLGKQLDMRSCGGIACVKMDTQSPRWGKNGEYVLLDSGSRTTKGK